MPVPGVRPPSATDAEPTRPPRLQGTGVRSRPWLWGASLPSWCLAWPGRGSRPRPALTPGPGSKHQRRCWVALLTRPWGAARRPAGPPTSAPTSAPGLGPRPRPLTSAPDLGPWPWPLTPRAGRVQASARCAGLGPVSSPASARWEVWCHCHFVFHPVVLASRASRSAGRAPSVSGSLWNWHPCLSRSRAPVRTSRAPVARVLPPACTASQSRGWRERGRTGPVPRGHPDSRGLFPQPALARRPARKEPRLARRPTAPRAALSPFLTGPKGRVGHPATDQTGGDEGTVSGGVSSEHRPLLKAWCSVGRRCRAGEGSEGLQVGRGPAGRRALQGPPGGRPSSPPVPQAHSPVRGCGHLGNESTLF